ncbi:unnamed protein product, partial [Allacma fusca]
MPRLFNESHYYALSTSSSRDTSPPSLTPPSELLLNPPSQEPLASDSPDFTSHVKSVEAKDNLLDNPPVININDSVAGITENQQPLTNPFLSPPKCAPDNTDSKHCPPNSCFSRTPESNVP